LLPDVVAHLLPPFGCYYFIIFYISLLTFICQCFFQGAKQVMELPVFSDLTSIEKELPFTLRGAGHNYVQKTISRPYGFPVYQIILCREGSGTIVLKDTESTIQPGQAIVLFPEEPHKYFPSEERWIISWVSFHGFQLADLFFKMQIKGSGVYNVTEPDLVDRNIAKAAALLSQPSVEHRLQGSALVYSMILDCYYQLHHAKRPMEELSQTALEPALYIIMNEYHRSIPLEELANACDISRQHFIRLFKASFNAKPTEYINTIRIEKSKELLSRFPDMKISDISRLCGFKSESYFSSVFRQYENMNPREFRNNTPSGHNHLS
jgi:AraC family transcriptional regulator, arabinose operon regulatory protein